MELDLKIIAQEAKSKKQENEAFRNFIKSIPTNRLDEKVFQLNESVSAKIDCTKCANCCKTVEPGVTQEEIGRLAQLNRQSTEEFIKSFISSEPGTGIQYLNHQPCIFLKENKCSIYEARPSSCADYPHLGHQHFKFRFKSIMNQYSVCPIVFNVVEELKKISGFRFQVPKSES